MGLSVTRVSLSTAMQDTPVLLPLQAQETPSLHRALGTVGMTATGHSPGTLTTDTGGGLGQKEILIDILIDSRTPLRHLWGLTEILGSDFTR